VIKAKINSLAFKKKIHTPPISKMYWSPFFPKTKYTILQSAKTKIQRPSDKKKRKVISFPGNLF
jgi:hypothetical protein